MLVPSWTLRGFERDLFIEYQAGRVIEVSTYKEVWFVSSQGPDYQRDAVFVQRHPRLDKWCLGMSWQLIVRFARQGILKKHDEYSFTRRPQVEE